jgi:hypothetical protein
LAVHLRFIFSFYHQPFLVLRSVRIHLVDVQYEYSGSSISCRELLFIQVKNFAWAMIHVVCMRVRLCVLCVWGMRLFYISKCTPRCAGAFRIYVYDNVVRSWRHGIVILFLYEHRAVFACMHTIFI